MSVHLLHVTTVSKTFQDETLKGAHDTYVCARKSAGSDIPLKKRSPVTTPPIVRSERTLRRVVCYIESSVLVRQNYHINATCLTGTGLAHKRSQLAGRNVARNMIQKLTAPTMDRNDVSEILERENILVNGHTGHCLQRSLLCSLSLSGDHFHRGTLLILGIRSILDDIGLRSTLEQKHVRLPSNRSVELRHCKQDSNEEHGKPNDDTVILPR